MPYQGGRDGILTVAQDLGNSAFEIFGPDTMYLHLSFNAAGSRAMLLLEDFSRPLPQMDFDRLMVATPRLTTMRRAWNGALTGSAFASGLTGRSIAARPAPAR